MARRSDRRAERHRLNRHRSRCGHARRLLLFRNQNRYAAGGAERFGALPGDRARRRHLHRRPRRRERFPEDDAGGRRRAQHRLHSGRGGSNPGDGDETGITGASEYNCCQIFRKDIILSGTALAINVFGSADNQLNRQTAFALGELARDLNRVALFGRRVEATATTRGEAGGLYFFGTRSNSPAIDALTTKLDSTLVNDAAQAVMGAGGDPTQILCSPGQARVLSCEYKNQLQILRSDDRRGAYVAVVVNEINGRGMTIMADPDVPDTDVWVLDPAGFGLSSLNGRAITDTDAPPKGFDGIKRMALGELTFVFRNAAQRICRISNLQASSEALAAIKAGN
ncbi:MAG: DUF5309 domain-containing protein [Lentisphaeria bacterium]|nr:MAG: DUF5309 domain-containing protein [Lentisphaeria bacterium]